MVLRKAMADAERLGLVPRNAAAAARPPAVYDVEHQTWDSEQLVQFFEHISGDRFFAASRRSDGLPQARLRADLKDVGPDD